jgi:hypothetical protein
LKESILDPPVSKMTVTQNYIFNFLETEKHLKKNNNLISVEVVVIYFINGFEISPPEMSCQ